MVENDGGERDLIDALLDYIASDFPEIVVKADELKAALRAEFSGNRAYIQRRSQAEREQLARKVLGLFNGRNATEVARRLNIGRATVYRIIKQGGRK